MHDAVVVEVGYGAQSSSDQIRSVRFVVGALAADAIEELAAESEVRDKVDCEERSRSEGLKPEGISLQQSSRKERSIRLFIVSK